MGGKDCCDCNEKRRLSAAFCSHLSMGLRVSALIAAALRRHAGVGGFAGAAVAVEAGAAVAFVGAGVAGAVVIAAGAAV
jgi:hypothetical protein